MNGQSEPTYPRARKDHQCNGCGCTIKRGDLYTRIVFFFDELTVSKLCPLCDWVWLTCEDFWCDGDLKEDHEFAPPDVVERFVKRATAENERKKQRIKKKKGNGAE